MANSNKLIKVGTTVNWRGSWGKDPAKPAKIEALDLCEKQGDKYGIDVTQIWAADKDRCVFTLDTGNWAYGTQIDLIETELIEANF